MNTTPKIGDIIIVDISRMHGYTRWIEDCNEHRFVVRVTDVQDYFDGTTWTGPAGFGRVFGFGPAVGKELYWTSGSVTNILDLADTQDTFAGVVDFEMAN